MTSSLPRLTQSLPRHLVTFAVNAAVDIAIAVVILFSLNCGPGLPDMRRLDAYVTSAETMCKRQADEPKATKLSVCRRALACIEPAKKAQHAVQDMLLTMAKMEDSLDDRLTAAAAYAGALASCGVVGVGDKADKVAAKVEVKPVMPSAALPAPVLVPNAANVIADRVVVAPTMPATPAPTTVPVAAPITPPATPSPVAPVVAPTP